MKICIICSSRYWGNYIANLFYDSEINCIISYTNSIKNYLNTIKNIIKSDVVLVIGGTIEKSKIIDIALIFNKKVVFFWIGTDVLKAKQLNKDKICKNYIFNCTHICECDWIKNELFEVGISADIVNIAVVNDNKKSCYNEWNKMKIICYSGEKREYFYGYENIFKLAELYPEFTFNVVGSSGKSVNKLPNIKFYGFVDDLERKFADNFLFIRVPEHDGLSVSVLEALSHKNWVIYSYPLKFAYNGCNFSEIKDSFDKVKKHFENKELNESAVNFVLPKYSEHNTKDNIQKFFLNLNKGIRK